MNASILGLGTAVPSNRILQSDALHIMYELFAFNLEQKAQLKKLYENSAIEKRHIVLDSLKELFNSGSTPGMSARNDVYKKEAIKLALNASEKAISNWKGNLQDITHVISVSCTGVYIPGIEFSLMEQLGLRRSIQRLGINFMGCFGAFKGLEVAHAFARENKSHRILVVCTELCSLQLQPDQSMDSLVANSIFSDGAAAVIVGCEPTSSEKGLWTIETHASAGLEQSTDQMSWEAKDHGFAMKLSQFVPLNIARHIRTFSEKLVIPYSSLENTCWAIHPGGRAILQTIEKKLGLKKEQTQASWHTLANYGNMSSATFLFVLQRLIEIGDQSDWTAGLGFGPGLSVEGILLKRPNLMG